MEQAENFEYDTIQVVQKVTFEPNCYKDCSAYSGNVMFNEIASVKKHNLRVLSDLLVASHSRKHTVRFKLDTGAGGNMLPYDVWQRFFPGRSNADLARTIDKSVSLQAYNKSEICQLGTCSLTVSHNGVSHTCHFFVVPSQYCPILGLSDLLTLHLVTFNCPTTTSWSSRTSVDALTCNAINETVVPEKPLTLTEVLDHPKYKPLFEGVVRFKIKPVEIKIKEGAIHIELLLREFQLHFKMHSRMN